MITNNAEWSEERREWSIPHFTYRERLVNFPKLHGMSKDMIEQERDRKEIVFRDTRDRKDSFDKRSSHDNYKMNNIIRGAREGSEMHSVPSGHYFKNGVAGKTGQLTPLKS